MKKKLIQVVEVYLIENEETPAAPANPIVQQTLKKKRYRPSQPKKCHMCGKFPLYKLGAHLNLTHNPHKRTLMIEKLAAMRRKRWALKK